MTISIIIRDATADNLDVGAIHSAMKELPFGYSVQMADVVDQQVYDEVVDKLSTAEAIIASQRGDLNDFKAKNQVLFEKVEEHSRAVVAAQDGAHSSEMALAMEQAAVADLRRQVEELNGALSTRNAEVQQFRGLLAESQQRQGKMQADHAYQINEVLGERDVMIIATHKLTGMLIRSGAAAVND